MGKKIFERKNFFAESNKHLKHTKGDGKKNFDETILTESKTDFGHMKFFGTLTSSSVGR